MKTLLSLFLLGLLSGAIAAQDVPERLVRAKYAIVAIQADKGELDYGESLSTPQEDRRARDAVEDALRKWKRYTITLLPGQAELLFVVHTARRGAVYVRGGPPLVDKGKVTIGRVPAEPKPPESQRGLTAGTEIGPDADLVEIYAVEDGRPGMLLWRGLKKNGLSGASPALIAEYKDKVDKTAKRLGLP